MFSSKAKRPGRTVHSQAAKSQSQRRQSQQAVVKRLSEQQRLRNFIERMNDRYE